MSKETGEFYGAIAGVVLIGLFVFSIGYNTLVGNERKPTKSSSYKNIPAGMSRAESNYIGNTAIEYGLSEQEAVQVRDAINKFRRAQENRK